MSNEGVLEQSDADLRQLVKAGEEVIGYIYPHVPLELFLAHGLTPSLVRSLLGVTGGFEESLQTFACSYIRNLYSQRTSNQLPNVSALLFPGNTCDSLQNLTDIWKYRFPGDRVLRLTYPVSRYTDDDSALTYLTEEIRLLSKAIEETFDRPFLNSSYERAVNLVRDFRESTQYLYGARIVDPEVISYAEVTKLIRLFLTTPLSSVVSEIHDTSAVVSKTMNSRGFSDMVTSILKSFRTRDFSSLTDFKGTHSPRIMIAGGMIDPQAIAAIFNGIQGVTDSIIVMDLLSFGFKTVFTSPILENQEPFEAMAKSILSAPGEPTHEGLQHRMRFLKDLSTALDIDGLVIFEQSFCDPDQFEAPSIERAASEIGLRTVRIPVDPEFSDRSRIEVRIQSFLESISETSGD